MIKVKNGIATREPLPLFLYGLMPESLVDLSWTDPALGVQDCGWWPEEYDNTPLAPDKKWGVEILTPDPVRQIVTVSRQQDDMTQQEKDDRDAAIKLNRKHQAKQARLNRESRGYLHLGRIIPADDASRLRLIELGIVAQNDPNFLGFYPSPVDPWFELDQALAVELSRSAAFFTWACIQREHEISVAIDDWTFTEEMLEQGWPA